MESFLQELKTLQSFLSLPQTINRSAEPRSITEEQICICVLGTTRQNIDLLLEGGIFCPGNVMIALSPSWLERKTGIKAMLPSGDACGQECPGDLKGESEDPYGSAMEHKNQPGVLLVRKAVTFGRGGSTFIDVFDPPRRVTYFINEIPGQFDATGLDCAVNGSKKLKTLFRDDIFWRSEMSKIGSPLLPSLVLHKDLTPDFKDRLLNTNEVTLISLNESPSHEHLKKYIENLCPMKGKDDKQIVILKKVMGASEKLTHSISETNLMSSILDDWAELGENDFIMIQPPCLLPVHETWTAKSVSSTTNLSQQRLYSVTARISISRGLNDHLILSKISAAVDPCRHSDRPDSNYQDLQITLSDLGYTDPVCLKYVKEEIRKQSKAVANTFINIETPLNPNYIGQRTDFLDITFRLCLIRGLVNPVLTCVTDKHICLDFWENRAMNSDPESPSRTILHVIVMRSHGVLLKDKTFLIAVDEIVVKHRISFFDKSRKCGNKIIVVTTRGTERLRELVEMVLEYDLTDLTDYNRHADNIMALLQKRGIVVSGCFTPRDCYTLLVCRLRELLGRRGPSEEAFNIADNKYLTYSTLWSMPSKRYSSKAMRVNNAEDLKFACQEIDFPVFIKLERGHGAIGAQVVKNEKECMNYYGDLSIEIANNLSTFELYGSATSVVLTEFLEGKEYAIDVVLFKGELMAAYIRNLSPHSPPSFVWRALSFPGNLTEDKRAMIIRASYQICIDIGLLDGVFNVEIMMTLAGPRLIEVNARQGNYAISHLIKQCLDEDFFLMQMLINLGIRPTIVPLPPQRKGYVFLLSSLHHKHLFADSNFVAMVDSLKMKNMIFYDTMRGFQPSTYDKVIACLGVVDEDAQKAKSTLLTIARALELESPFYPCEYFLKNI